MKKLPHSLSLDDLLKVLENKEDHSLETIIEESDNDVLLFLTTLKINKGNERIKKKLLYKLYYNWSDTPVSQVSFTIKLSYYIDHETNYYLINENTFKLTNKIKKIVEPRRDVRKNKDYTKHFQYFLDKFKLKKGSDLYITGSTVYFLYDNWCYSNNKRPLLGDRGFHIMLNHNLGPYKLLPGKAKIYGLQKEAKEILTDEFIKKAIEWSAARYNTKEAHKKNKEKNKEGKNKISSTRSVNEFKE